jgi:hypothetical protein
MDAARRAIEDAAGFTKFTTDASHMFELRADKRHPQAWSDAEVLAKYEADFTAEDRAWIESEFSRAFAAGDKVYRFTRLDLARLAVKFGRSLRANEELYDFIARTKAASTGGRAFDFEPSIDEAETLTTASELIFYLQWLKARGRPAQLVPPNLGFKKRQAYPEEFSALETYVGHKMWPELLPRVAEEFGSRPLNELAARVGELAGVARHFNATLSVHSGSGKQASVLEQIGRATSGRVNYKISGELQLQLFDVLSEQAPGSEWRMLYERMVERCEGFAAGGAFGEESGLAAKYRQMRRGLSLGNSARGRVDGNLFLVFWLGNMVGSRDSDGVFFKDKLDRLPRELVKEVRRRNSEYIVWLAQHLRP